MKNPGIYILTSPSVKQYVGRDVNLPHRATQHLRGKEPTCPRIHNAIKKYGADTFSVEIIRYPGISQEALNAVERWWIRRLQTLSPSGCNPTEGGDGVIASEETRQKISKKASQRVEERTHNLLGNSNPVHKRIADGTHNFLGGDIARRTTQKRRTIHPKNALIVDGTHNFLGENNPIKRLSKEGRNPQTLKRLKGEWCYIIALSRFWYEIHDYTLKRRAEFLSKDIPDTSNAEQEYLF